MASVYERIGGEVGIMAAVGIFYDKVTDDPLLAPFFNRLDMKSQSRKQVAFMSWVFNGPSQYRGRDLTQAHAKLVSDMGLGDEHFDACVKHLRATLVDLDMTPDVIDEAISTINGIRGLILGG